MNFTKFKLEISILLLLCSSMNAPIFSQQKCELKDFPDLFESKSKIKVEDTITKTHFFFVLPYLGFQPATGFSYGAISQYIFKGKGETDRYSEIYSIAKYSQKKQLLIDFVNNVYLKHNSILLNGDFRYYIFTQSNYGLGSDNIPYGEKSSGFDLTDIEQPMDYTYIRFHQLASFRVKENLYLGGGFHYDGYSKIDDKLLDVPNGIETYHYTYNKKNNFDLEKYSVIGASFNTIFDSRNNSINPNRGSFVNLNLRFNPKLGDNQVQSAVLLSEFRHYISLSKNSEQNVLAFWLYGQFVVNGTLPYLNLPSVGWDQRSRQGKGYTQGLFRGNNLVSFETEYRFPITCNELISGTVFTNLVTVSDEGRIPLFHTIQPAIGVGLRVLLDKKTKTNIVLNYAQGHKSQGFYLNTDEAF